MIWRGKRKRPPTMRDFFGTVTMLPPMWVGQCRVKSSLEESRVGVMMTYKLDLTCQISIFAMELDIFSSLSEMTS
jgi:hypothetical protein